MYGPEIPGNGMVWTVHIFWLTQRSLNDVHSEVLGSSDSDSNFVYQMIMSRPADLK